MFAERISKTTDAGSRFEMNDKRESLARMGGWLVSLTLHGLSLGTALVLAAEFSILPEPRPLPLGSYNGERAGVATCRSGRTHPLFRIVRLPFRHAEGQVSTAGPVPSERRQYRSGSTAGGSFRNRLTYARWIRPATGHRDPLRGHRQCLACPSYPINGPHVRRISARGASNHTCRSSNHHHGAV
jgi:hypothetical protein